MSDQRAVLPGSDRAPLPSASVVGSIAADERIDVTVVLRRRAELPAEQIAAGSLTSKELATTYGADPADVDLVRSIVTSAGAEIEQVDLASRRLRLRGSAAVLSTLFGTQLAQATLERAGDSHSFRTRTGQLSVPAELADIVVAVLGLDNRPQAAPKLRLAPAAARTHSYTPLQLAAIYDLPDADGAGESVAIIELGGGFGQADLDTYFAGLGLPTPVVTAVGVDGAANAPGADPSGADGEVLLDIEVVGGIAAGAAIVVYFAPNTDAGFLDAVSTAAHASPAPAAISISWGQSEDDWTAQARHAMDAAFADAAALGVTVTVAAGDDGSTDRAADGGVHVDFPASSPHVLACGGTNLVASSSAVVTSETVWNNGAGNGATGGGISRTFALPSWQRTAGVPTHPDTGKHGRGVPDVAGDADPRTGYQVLVDGTATVIGGTSAVAPLWAGIAARLSQLLGARQGLLASKLYAGVSPGQAVPGLRDITVGNNGSYRAAPGWDACTGLGVPDGQALLRRLRAQPPSQSRVMPERSEAGSAPN